MMIRFLTCLIILAFLHSNPIAYSAQTTTRFRADLDASVVQPQTAPNHDQSTATAVANLVLTYDDENPQATTLAYEVIFNGLDIAPTDNINLFDDVTAVHIHDTTVCANAALCGDGMGGKLPGSTAGTRHVLNILGVPREDDDDLLVFADEERITGVWDPTDQNDLAPAPSASIAEPAILNLLFSGQLAVMVHTKLIGTGEIGGFIVQVPEPATGALIMTVGVCCTARRWR